MAYYEDLSDYVYSAPGWRGGARNVGWLDRNHKFDLATPTEATLGQLWEHCRIFVMSGKPTQVKVDRPSGTDCALMVSKSLETTSAKCGT